MKRNIVRDYAVICLAFAIGFGLIKRLDTPERPAQVQDSTYVGKKLYYNSVMSEIKRREGLRLEKYVCPAGKPTIGYGQTGDIPDTVTKGQAIQMLHETFEEHYSFAQKEFPTLKRNQHLAVAMLTYNIGTTRFKNTKVYKKLKSGNTDVSSEWLTIKFYRTPKGRYKESPNLIQAREFEIALFND